MEQGVVIEDTKNQVEMVAQVRKKQDSYLVPG